MHGIGDGDLAAPVKKAAESAARDVPVAWSCVRPTTAVSVGTSTMPPPIPTPPCVKAAAAPQSPALSCSSSGDCWLGALALPAAVMLLLLLQFLSWRCGAARIAVAFSGARCSRRIAIATMLVAINLSDSRLSAPYVLAIYITDGTQHYTSSQLAAASGL